MKPSGVMGGDGRGEGSGKKRVCCGRASSSASLEFSVDVVKGFDLEARLYIRSWL